MMRVRMRTLSAGPRGVRRPGEEHEVSEEEGRALVKGHYADEVRKPPKPEQAVAGPAETAVAPPAEKAVAGPEEEAHRGRGRPRRER